MLKAKYMVVETILPLKLLASVCRFNFDKYVKDNESLEDGKITLCKLSVDGK